MSDTMPQGVTPLKTEDPNLEQLERTTKQIQETQKQFQEYSKSIKVQTQLMKNAGSTPKQIAEYLKSVQPMFAERAEKYEETIVGLGRNLENTYKEMSFTDIEQQKFYKELIGQMNIENEEQIETVKKQNEFLTKLKDDVGVVLETTTRQTTDAFMGPLKLITEPIKELTGFDIVDSFIGGFKSIFGKDKDKVKPKREDLLKKGVEGTSAVYIADEMKKIFGEEDEEGVLDEWLKGLEGGALPDGIAKMLGSGLSLLAIAGSIIWSVIDAIAAVGMAEEWGTSKISAGIAGFFAGTGSGWSGAFAMAGKWALMGAGIGFLAGGPVGALAGGLLGAAVGGILGFIGGENLAKAFDAIGKWFSSIWEGVVDFFINNPLGQLISKTAQSIWEAISAPFKAIWETVQSIFGGIMDLWADEDKSLMDKILGTIWEVVTGIPKLIGSFFMGFLKGLGNLFMDVFIGTKDAEGKRTQKSLIQMGGELLLDLGLNILKWIGSSVAGIFKSGAKFIGNIGSFINKTVIQPIASFFSDLWGGVTNIAEDVGEWVFDWILDPIGKAIGGVFKIGGEIFDMIVDAFEDFIVTPLANMFKWVDIQVSKILDLGPLNMGEGKSEAYEKLSFAGIDASSVMRAAEYGLGIDRGYGFAGRTDIFKKENQEDLINILKQLGYNDELIKDVTEESVDDAIITNTGKIIRVSPEDNLIATKNQPTIVEPISGRDQSIMNDIASMNMKDQERQGNEMINLLRELINAVKDKPFNNIVQQNNNTSNMDFDHLRTVGV